MLPCPNPCYVMLQNCVKMFSNLWFHCIRSLDFCVACEALRYIWITLSSGCLSVRPCVYPVVTLSWKSRIAIFCRRHMHPLECCHYVLMCCQRIFQLNIFFNSGQLCEQPLLYYNMIWKINNTHIHTLCFVGSRRICNWWCWSWVLLRGRRCRMKNRGEFCFCNSRGCWSIGCCAEGCCWGSSSGCWCVCCRFCCYCCCFDGRWWRWPPACCSCYSVSGF